MDNIHSIIERLESKLDNDKGEYLYFTNEQPLNSVSYMYMGRCSAIEEILKELYKVRAERAVRSC